MAKRDHSNLTSASMVTFLPSVAGEVIRSPTQAEMDAVTLLTLVYEMVISNAMAYFSSFLLFIPA